MITNPGSFVMSLNTASSSFPFQAARAPFPTAPYYAFAPTASPANMYAPQQQMMKAVNLSTPASAGNQGAWSDEETEKLKRLTEENRARPESNGEIDWDWVCSVWGAGRTRCFSSLCIDNKINGRSVLGTKYLSKLQRWG